MLTSAITAAITAALAWLGVEPGPYVAGVWLAVKLVLVGAVALIGWRAARKRQLPAAPHEVGGAPSPRLDAHPQRPHPPASQGE